MHQHNKKTFRETNKQQSMRLYLRKLLPFPLAADSQSILQRYRSDNRANLTPPQPSSLLWNSEPILFTKNFTKQSSHHPQVTPLDPKSNTTPSRQYIFHPPHLNRWRQRFGSPPAPLPRLIATNL